MEENGNIALEGGSTGESTPTDITLGGESAGAEIPADITLEDESAKGEDPDNINGTEKTEKGSSAPETAEKYGRAAEREEYDRLIKTRFKDFYTEDTQRMINRRFKHYKALAEKYKTLEESLAAAPEKTRPSNDEIVEKIRASAGDISSKHEGFSLDEAKGSEKFMALARFALEEGSISLSDAYTLSFYDKILSKEKERIEREAEQRIYDRIRANRQRGRELGVLPQTSGRGIDASRLTKSERAELARRAANGEKIGF